MSKICFAAILAMITASLSAQVTTPQKTAAPGDFPQRSNMRVDALKEFDKDGDGKLNDDERKAMMDARKALGEKMRKDREKEFDKNGDGKLDEAEKTAMMAAQTARMEQFKKAREKQFDKDGDGKLSDEERKAMMAEFQKRRPNTGPQFQEMMKRFDKDGDGKFNDEERKAMIEERAKMMANQGAPGTLPKPPAGTNAVTPPAK